eukprot:515821-Amphidinium_carterae.1
MKRGGITTSLITLIKSGANTVSADVAIGREDRHHTQREADQQGTPVVQLDYSFLTDGELQIPLLAAIDN